MSDEQDHPAGSGSTGALRTSTSIVARSTVYGHVDEAAGPRAVGAPDARRLPTISCREALLDHERFVNTIAPRSTNRFGMPTTKNAR